MSPTMRKPAADDTPTPSVQVLERAFALLDVLARHSDPVPLKELAQATGLPVRERLVLFTALGRTVPV